VDSISFPSRTGPFDLYFRIPIDQTFDQSFYEAPNNFGNLHGRTELGGIQA
jgi:hypothetical protein